MLDTPVVVAMGLVMAVEMFLQKKTQDVNNLGQKVRHGAEIAVL
jgi:hypothetical protein